MTFSTLLSGIELRAPVARLATVADFLSRFMDRPVVDLTALTRRYDLKLALLQVVPAGIGAADGTKQFPEQGAALLGRSASSVCGSRPDGLLSNC